MPNTASAIRRVRRVAKQTTVNRIRKSKYKTAIKKMEDLIKSNETEKIKKYLFVVMVDLHQLLIIFYVILIKA